MSIEHNHGCEEIKIDESNSLLVETKSEEGYRWKEVNYKSNDGGTNTYIGTYYTYDYSSSRAWMEYNSNYVAILKITILGYEVSDPRIDALFDVKEKKLVVGTQEELFDIYKREFSADNKVLAKKQ